jgi:hypothetical protein
MSGVLLLLEWSGRSKPSSAEGEELIVEGAPEPVGP